MKEEEEEEVQPITKAPVKTEMNGETPKLNLASTLRCSRSNGCGRSRQNLSEVWLQEVHKFSILVSFFLF